MIELLDGTFADVQNVRNVFVTVSNLYANLGNDGISALESAVRFANGGSGLRIDEIVILEKYGLVNKQGKFFPEFENILKQTAFFNSTGYLSIQLPVKDHKEYFQQFGALKKPKKLWG